MSSSEPNFESLGVTKEFLENAMSYKWPRELCRIQKFNLSKGSQVGDGYTTTLVRVDIWLEKAREFLENFESTWFDEHGNLSDRKQLDEKQKNSASHVTLVIKCILENAAQQAFVQATNAFTTEVGVYREILPQLIKFQDNLNLNKILRPPFLPFVSGRVLPKKEIEEFSNTRQSVALDNYLMMLDIRRHGGFQLRDRFMGFDLDHYKLVVEAQAKLHAISWAYKHHVGVPDLRSLYSYLQKDKSKAKQGWMVPVMKSHLDIARAVTRHELGGNEEILRGIDNHENEERMMEGFQLYYDYDPKFDPNFSSDAKACTGQSNPMKFTKDSIMKIPGTKVEDEEPWLVLLHGDAWSNNIMFRYDPASGKPVQAILLDLQIARIGDPLSDLVYTLYTATTRKFRSKHLTSMLHLYFDKFVEICSHMSCPTLPNFTWSEFIRRFHRAKSFALSIGVFTMPIDLKIPTDLVDSDSWTGPLPEKENDTSSTPESANQPPQTTKSTLFGFADTLTADHDYSRLHPVLKERLRDLLQDMSDDGIL